ncbi:MAG: patatin-like phospholipase family protein [Spirochaetia bacterium]|jgi:NTE family protein|nr:patatin-like phospholipase family protein [Spirochaetia bacterium]
MKRVFYIFTAVVLPVFFCAQLSAAEPDPASSPPLSVFYSEDPIFMTDVPLSFGKELFVKRISEKSPDKLLEISSVPEDAGNYDEEKPLGLVFSGGAARAFAHIGVLKRLEEDGIIPDFIVANSMGSIVALLYAAGASPDLIERLIIEYPTDALFRPEIPLNGGVLDTSRYVSQLYRLFGPLDLKDLKIPVAIISEDLETRRQIIFMEGDFYKIMQASISMPFSFPPVRYNGMTLIDGGVTNLTPVDTAAEHTDRIIVSTAFYNRENDYRNFVTIINRAFDIGKTRKGIGQLKNINTVLIRCDVENFSYMDFQEIGSIVERGYGSADKMSDILAEKGFKLGNTWDKTRLEKLDYERSILEIRFDELTSEYKRTGIIQQKEISGRMYMGFDMYGGIRDDFYLDDSSYLFLGQSAELGYLQAGVMEYWSPGEGYGLDGRADFALFKMVVFKNRITAGWEDLDYDNTIIYNRVDLNITDDGEKGMRPFFAREGYYSRETELSLKESFTRSGCDFYAGDYFISPYWFNQYSHTGGSGIENDFKIKTIGKLYLDQRSVLRIPFESEEKISLFKNDGLRGYTREGSFDRVLVTNNSLTFRTETALSFGEIFLVKDFAASVFCDYFETDESGLSAGIAVDLNISFIGLTSLFFTAYAGYDYLNNEIFSSVAAGNRH